MEQEISYTHICLFCVLCVLGIGKGDGSSTSSPRLMCCREGDADRGIRNDTSVSTLYTRQSARPSRLLGSGKRNTGKAPNPPARHGRGPADRSQARRPQKNQTNPSPRSNTTPQRKPPPKTPERSARSPTCPCRHRSIDRSTSRALVRAGSVTAPGRPGRRGAGSPSGRRGRRGTARRWRRARRRRWGARPRRS